MNKPRLLLIGLGSIGLELVKRLVFDFSITCLDSDSSRIEAASDLRLKDIVFKQGDATSRLVLEQTGAAEADTIVITIAKERVNLEIARVLRQGFENTRIISVGITPQGIKILESMQIQVVNIFTTSAFGIINTLRQHSRTVHGIGLNQDEIREVEVRSGSNLVNRPLSEIKPVNWNAGIIYRDGNIVIPKGASTIKPSDRVVILGNPSVLDSVSAMLTFRNSRFPLEYGDTMLSFVAGNEDEKYFEELSFLISSFKPKEVVFAVSKRTSGSEKQNVSNRLNSFDAGIKSVVDVELENLTDIKKNTDKNFCLVTVPGSSLFPKRAGLFSLYGGRKKTILKNISNIFRCPVLVTAKSFPYSYICIVCAGSTNPVKITENALEISSVLKSHLTALMAAPSKYFYTDEELEQFQNAVKTVSDLSAVYKQRISITELTGNPVKSIGKTINSFNMIVMDASGLRTQNPAAAFFSPDIAWEIMKQAKVTVMLVNGKSS